MKLIANDYEAKYVFKILREWTDLTQEQLAQELNMSIHGLKKYENGQNRFFFETIIEICKNHGITITFEKKM